MIEQWPAWDTELFLTLNGWGVSWAGSGHAPVQYHLALDSTLRVDRFFHI
jgi:hypothetical protein